MMRLSAIVILQAIVAWQCLVYGNTEVDVEDEDSPGEPLFLTPYLERGDVAEARRLARVPLLDHLHIESYAGFFTVNKNHDSNHFYWYFPSMSADRKNDPVVVWLEGGPGSSGFINIFLGNGPVSLKNHTFGRRDYHWALNHHMIYIDNPVGTGFSFTKHSEGICTNQMQIAEHLYSSLTQFFQLFPELQQNKVFIAGESYGGKHAPALGYAIHKKNPTAETKINLKGLVIGNGLTDPENQLSYGQYLYQIGLIDLNERKIFEEYEAKTANYIRNGKWLEAYNTSATLIDRSHSYFNNFTGFDSSYKFLDPNVYFLPGIMEYESMLHKNSIRKAIHVGDLTFHNGSVVFDALKPDLMKSVAPWLSELLEHYDCLIYSGQLDIIVAYPLTLNYLQKLNFSGAEEYKTAKRSIWRVDGEVAGYVKQGGRLVELLVRNAGHAVTIDQPKWAMDMIQRFTHNTTFWNSSEAQMEDGDSGPGEPLFLTPYLERGDVAEARRLARVPLLVHLHIESYAGFFTVNKTHDSNHFYWYIPSMSADRKNDPVVVWLEGGPGGSGLLNVFLGNGPVDLKNHTFIPKEYHWARNHHMIYIDNPVGAGFSFTKHKDGYCTDEAQIAEHLYSSLTQFFQLFPELQQNKFFITGESYAGKYVPALGYVIHKKNPTAETKINLQGLAIGNGMTDPENQLMYGRFLYEIGLIDVNERKIFEEYEAKIISYIRNGQWIEASNTYLTLILEKKSYFNNVTGYDAYFNYLYTDFKDIESHYDYESDYILKQNAFRKAIHVGNLTFQNSSLLEKILLADIMKSVAPWLSELLDHYHCLVYTGQLDIIVAYPLTLNYLQKLNFSGAEEYKTAKRSIWRVDGELAGYAKQGGNLVEVLVRNAGHPVIWDQPKWAMDMIQRFTHNTNFWDSSEDQLEDDSSGPGEPLFLTPYLERGDVTEARRLARVPLLDQLHIESYAGFFTVNKTHDSNHFYWYFPSMSADRKNDPVVVWLEGGPGSSGLINIFLGNGPVSVKNHTFGRRDYHWALNHHMIYIDSPVGTGFSFTKYPEGFCTDQMQIAEHLYSSLTQFFQLFPELQQNKFFIAGESYGGKYVPALGYAIHKKNPTAETKINLEGLIIGNGLTDPENQLLYGQYLYQIGLIDLNERKIFEEYEAKTANYIRNGKWLEAYNTLATLILQPLSYFNNFTGFDSYYKFLDPNVYFLPGIMEYQSMLPKNSFRKAIHVGNLTFHESSFVFNTLKQDMMKSVAPWLSELLEHYKCLIYSGQLDIIVAYPLTLNYLQKLNFSGAEEYKAAKRSIWRVDGEVAGYVKQGGKLVEVLVRNAGHGVTMDQPKWTLELVQNFTRNNENGGAPNRDIKTKHGDV